MTLTRKHAAILVSAVAVAAGAALSGSAQTQSPQGQAQPVTQVSQPAVRPQPTPALTPARAVIFLDAAHGGSETGAALGNNVSEKDVTLAFVQRLRPALASAGFNVITTRDSDLTAPLLTDQRAETANRSHALACILIHATASGSGVHLYTSTLPAAPSADSTSPASSQSDATTPFTPIPWESAQANFVEQSRRLSDLFKATFAKAGLPVLAGTAPLRPLDSLMCPAVAIEVAPNSASVSAADSTYQQQLAVALESALQIWRTQNTVASSAPLGGTQ